MDNSKFIVDKDKEEDLVEVLTRQHQMGIGWAVVWEEGMNSTTREDQNVSKDFAIFDGGAAISFFRESREWIRYFRAIFNTENNKNEITRQVTQHRNILAKCWLVNGQLKINLGYIVNDNDIRKRVYRTKEKLRMKLKNRLSNDAKKINFEPDETSTNFLLEVSNDGDVREMVRLFILLRREIEEWNKGGPQRRLAQEQTPPSQAGKGLDGSDPSLSNGAPAQNGIPARKKPRWYRGVQVFQGLIKVHRAWAGPLRAVSR
jgi:hypothetical protein